MEPSGIFKNLSLDMWYKALVYVGGIILILSIFMEVKGIANIHVQLLSLGVFLIGLGEWKNHKIQLITRSPSITDPGALIQAYVRKNDLFGVILEIVGGFCLVVGLISVIFCRVPL